MCCGWRPGGWASFFSRDLRPAVALPPLARRGLLPATNRGGWAEGTALPSGRGGTALWSSEAELVTTPAVGRRCSCPMCGDSGIRWAVGGRGGKVRRRWGLTGIDPSVAVFPGVAGE